MGFWPLYLDRIAGYSAEEEVDASMMGGVMGAEDIRSTALFSEGEEVTRYKGHLIGNGGMIE